MVQLDQDLELVYKCLHNISNTDNSTVTARFSKLHEREEGGIQGTLLPWPVYFYDENYRERKHKSLRKELEADEISRKAYVKGQEQAELARRAQLLKNSKILPY